MRIAFVLLFFMYSLAGSAQRFSSEMWHDGLVVTSDRDTIQGSVKYDMVSNTVLISRNNVVQTYNSYKLFYVEIYDQLLSNYRQFYTVPFAYKSDYEIPTLFELLYEGPLSLLAREAIVTQTSSANTAFYGAPIVQNVLQRSYYFLDTKGKMDFYTGRKADLFVIMSKHGSDVKKFIKSNKLRVDDPRDLIRIAAFYNSL